ncbi:phycobiliprotein lyase [Oscillatoria sp. FACHB-1407]|uniref:phycobiliprotein lyase n=1 Tax=Oscillatoria sp. FACHB-1407 TaxID=2692847 RepID=UPI0016877285|nr:phycobiliprotein lyase [Oscillatoria sp. FACHB-1407]MBD2462635.1 phycobiliprotein lyase [Oscillatoria sp. FACHB-1407]
MDITAFFQHSAGKWISQRTSHNFASKQSENGKSTLQIEVMPSDAPDVIKLCELHGVDPASALIGMRISWEGNMDWKTQKQIGSTVLVPLADPAQTNAGRLLSGMGSPGQPSVSGRYVMGSDDALTLITESDTMYFEERIWFAGDNLRLRNSLLKPANGATLASFCSEIRMISQPAPATTPATEEASPTS